MARCPISVPNYSINHLHYFTEFPILHSLKRSMQLRFSSSLPCTFTRHNTTSLDTHSRSCDNLGFDPLPTDYVYIMRCSEGEEFTDGELQPYGKIQLNPFSSILNYGQGVIESLKVYKKDDGSLLLFRPSKHGLRMKAGADSLCMPAPTVDQFVESVKVTVLANRQWVPPSNKGFLHIRPLLIGSGPVLQLTTSPAFIFMIYVTPVRDYFEEGTRPIDLLVENEIRRAVPGGVGWIKATGNYAGIMKAQVQAKARGFDDVLYLDSVETRYLKEISTANIFIVKNETICTPELTGTILPGITRETIIDIAGSQGFKVEERRVSVEEVFDADEVFCTGNTIGVMPVNSITYSDKRICYGPGTVSRQLYSILRNIQTGLTEDKMGWTVLLNKD